MWNNNFSKRAVKWTFCSSLCTSVCYLFFLVLSLLFDNFSFTIERMVELLKPLQFRVMQPSNKVSKACEDFSVLCHQFRWMTHRVAAGIYSLSLRQPVDSDGNQTHGVTTVWLNLHFNVSPPSWTLQLCGHLSVRLPDSRQTESNNSEAESFNISPAENCWWLNGRSNRNKIQHHLEALMLLYTSTALHFERKKKTLKEHLLISLL